MTSGRQLLQPRPARAEAAAGQELQLFSFRPTQDRWEFEDQKAVVFVLLLSRPRSGPLSG